MDEANNDEYKKTDIKAKENGIGVENF